MDYLLLVKALILGLVEGLTEFLPVSSTGHLIVVGDLLNFNDARGKLFEIAIQSGAILAVCWVYRQKISEIVCGLPRQRAAQNFVLNLAIAYLPLAVLGLLFGSWIKAHLFNAPVVASTFILGGLLILWTEARVAQTRVHELEQLSPADALKLGLAQALALIPGTSRSGAMIIGGLYLGLSRRAATEFSFFLAIPTLISATLYQLYKERALLSFDDMGMWLTGFAAAFVAALWAVRGLLRYISTHSFKVFAWYRIAFGLLILLSWRFAWLNWSVA
ncbi:MAG: undecaprenyl-diphosphate phosphatase [Pseudomonadota bacterium]